MKQRTRVFIALLCMSLAGVASAGTSFSFSAFASGEQEVPPVATTMSGKMTMRFDRALRDVDYVLTVRKGIAITQAHLHCAPAGTNGSVLAFLFNAGPVDVNGRLVKGTLTNDSLTGCGVTTIAQLFAAMRSGGIYLNVHTVANPGGEIRAQFFPR